MLTRSSSRSVRLSVRALRTVCFLVGLVLAGDAAAAFDADEQSCIVSVARAFVDASTTGANLSAGCMAAAMATREGEPSKLNGGTVERCITFDPAVWRKRNADSARSQRLCARAVAGDPSGGYPPSEFGLSPIDAEAAARTGIEGLTHLLRDVFGPAPDEALRTIAEAPGAQTCQRATWAATRACSATRQSSLLRCLRDGLAERDPLRLVRDTRALRDHCLGTGSDGQPDPQGSIARSCSSAMTGLPGVIERRCAGEDLAALFPGCSGEAATAACIERKTACRTCLTVNRALGTTRNCDQFDNGEDDGSCGCGDGLPTPAEQCDDGNDVEDDGCTSSCTEGPAYCPCYTETEIDAAFPPGFFASSGEPACVDDELGAGFTAGTCLLPAPRDVPYTYPRLGAGIIDGICFFQPTPLAERDGDWCGSPDFELVTGARIAGCRNVMRRSQAWQRECGR